METVTLEEASAHLAGLVDRVAENGEEIVIMRDSQPVAKLDALSVTRGRPRFGSAKGLIVIAEDFDAPLETSKSIRDAVTARHTRVVILLPFHHRDPFDRMLVAQSLVEQMPLVSIDAALDAYGVRRLW